MLALLGSERQVLADIHARRGGFDGIERPAIGEWRFGFHIPHVDVRRAAAQEKQNDGFGRLFAATQRISRSTKQGVRRKFETACSSRGSHEKRAPIHKRIFDDRSPLIKGICLANKVNRTWCRGL